MNLHHLLAIPACLVLLASCNESDRKLFRKMDTNRDRRLSLAEVNEEGLPRIFSLYDVNGDGCVTLAEARSVDATFTQTKFTIRDANRDGKVSYAEFERYARTQGGLRRQFARVDTNGDGYIDQAEARCHVAAMEGTTTASR